MAIAEMAPLHGRSAQVNGEKSLDIVASYTQSFRNTGTASLKGDHLIFRSPQAASGTRFIFVVDSSGSINPDERPIATTFRGAKAEIVLEPCRNAEAAHRVLEFLPTGSRTPLAHALEVARSLVNSSSLVVLLTDGRANVSIRGGDPWEEALNTAGKLNCPAVLVDSSLNAAAACGSLASAMRARLVRLDDMSRETLLNVLHS